MMMIDEDEEEVSVLWLVSWSSPPLIARPALNAAALGALILVAESASHTFPHMRRKTVWNTKASLQHLQRILSTCISCSFFTDTDIYVCSQIDRHRSKTLVKPSRAVDIEKNMLLL